MKKIILLILFLTACSNIEYNNCSEEKIGEIGRGIDSALLVFEGADYALDKLTVSCSDNPPYADVPCVTWQYGTSPIPGYRTRIAVQNIYAGKCMIHELHHVSLYATFGDGCTKHDPSCNWDYFKIEEANDIFESLTD